MSASTIFSIICPTLNEEKHIQGLMDMFLQHCPMPSELFITDGGSQDRTREIVSKYAALYPQIKLLDNPKRFVSYGFNTAFPHTTGKYIGFLGAHTVYPPRFFQAALDTLESGDCDVVGGPLRQSGRGLTGQAIAYCMSTRMGVGDTAFRTSKKRQYVDSVAFAIYKRVVFEHVGLLDTALIRNQDDELHYRINAYGYRILMIPEMECEYIVRDAYSKLFKQYYEYGYYKPLVLKKVRSGVKLRHLIPAFFVLYILSLPLVFMLFFWVIPLILYTIIAFYFSFINNHPLSIKLRSLVVYPVLHISYGAGFLHGLVA